MRTNYQSSVLAAPGRIELRRLPMPQPSPRQVVVRLEGCGVCGSNLPVWQGREWFKYPLEPGSPGHEGWGRVESVGEQVETVTEGDRVALLSHHSFAEVDVADVDHAVKLPPMLDSTPFPGEALGCAMNVFQRANISRGDDVAIIGVGFLGALLVQLAASAGARVVAISRRSRALEMARSMGAQHGILLNDRGKTRAAALEVTGGREFNRVIEATGHQMPLDLATDLIGERGTLVIAGYHQDGLRQVNMQVWNWKGIDVINAHERDPQIYLNGMRAAAGAIAEGRLDPTPLYTHHFALDQMGAALDALDSRDGNFMKALLVL
jgi:2-desacetyl-2-hydroxyethyl bacteriochlorophyllide A dehydrogenase